VTQDGVPADGVTQDGVTQDSEPADGVTGVALSQPRSPSQPGPAGTVRAAGLANRPGARRVAWFHCFAGIAGDMALGSLIDAGADVDEVRALLERLPLSGWSLEAAPVSRGGIAAHQAIVSVTDSVVVRTYAHIVGLIEEARLPARVTERSLATFAVLAAVESRLHRRPIEQVHFHEVGGHDTIIDIVGVAAALEVLGVDDIETSPVATGLGVVRAAHGLLPNPAPAVVGLLEGIPTWGRDLAVELTTPTGAALLAALAVGTGPLPAMVIEASGFGAGSRELTELPNCTQVVIGSRVPARERGSRGSAAAEVRLAGRQAMPRVRAGVGTVGPARTGDVVPDVGPGQPVFFLEANLDDVTGEQLAHTIQQLLDAGAHDAWLTPVVMKKGRPGTTIHVLCDPVDAPSLRSLLRSETGTLGVRGGEIERWPVARHTDTVEVEGCLVRVKVSADRCKAEHEDVARVARQLGLPLRAVAHSAEQAWEAGRVAPTSEPGAPVDPG